VRCEARPRATADADRDAPQPVLELICIAQARQPQQSDQQRVLDAIIRQCRAGDASAQARQVRNVRRDEHTERRPIAAYSKPHEHLVAARSVHVR